MVGSLLWVDFSEQEYSLIVIELFCFMVINVLFFYQMGKNYWTRDNA